jgi:hypothetical protein
MLALVACYASNPPLGAPCDPGANNCPTGQACIAQATGHACLPEGTVPELDASLPDDAIPVVAPCPQDPALRVCFSFDSPMLATPLANEGLAPVSAELTNVRRISEGTGGAALIDTTSAILVSPNDSIVDIVALEARIRLDVAVPSGQRVGIIDAADVTPGMSMFVFDGNPGERVRCTIGGMDVFADAAIPLATFVHITCVCDDGMLTIFLDGTQLVTEPGCVPSVGTTRGLQLGQNSNAEVSLPPDEWLVGAIDLVRLWTVPPPITL